ncbi:MAG: transcription antitermination factor NusB [Spirochaetaceae bacterium]|nr:MAG: transcription antitermination factor NusB [Spirochaetaceae bacterium]
MGARHRGRTIAMQALFSWDINRRPVGDLCDLDWLEPEQRDGEAADFARLLIAGALEHVEDIDTAISDHLEHWTLGRLAKVDLAILRLSAYSLLYQSDVAAGITINEAITLAKEYGTDDSYRFVNGVLDSIRTTDRP